MEKVETKPTNDDSHQAASKISALANIQVSTRNETDIQSYRTYKKRGLPRK